MLKHFLELAGEAIANIVVFALAVALSTGLSCEGKAACCGRNQASEVAAP